MNLSDAEIMSVSRLLRSNNHLDREVAHTFLALFDMCDVKRLIAHLMDYYTEFFKRESVLKMIELYIPFEHSYRLKIYISYDDVTLQTVADIYFKSTKTFETVHMTCNSNKKRKSYKRHGRNFEKRLLNLLKYE